MQITNQIQRDIMPRKQKCGSSLPTFYSILALALATFVFSPIQINADENENSTKLENDIQKARAEMAQTRKEIAKADADLAKTDSILKDEITRANQSDERAGKDRERREKENQALQNHLKEIQEKVNAEKSLQGRHSNAMDEIKAKEKNLSLTLAGYCDSLINRIENALPWDKEPRIERLKALHRDLESGTATPDEGLGRLSAALKEEIKIGDEISLLNKPLTKKNGEVINAQILKIGNQWMVYMDEDGKNFGVLEHKGGQWEWREDPSFSEKNQIRLAIEVKSAKRAPQLVTLSLGMDTQSKNSSKANASPGAKK